MTDQERRSGVGRRSADQRITDLEQHVKKQDRKNYIYYALVIALVGLVSFFYFKSNDDNKSLSKSNQTAIHRLNGVSNRIVSVQSRINKDEAQTCTVQARGLPAGHDLATTIGDISVFLSDLTSMSPPSERNQTPPKIEALLEAIVKNGRAYAKIEAKQPKTRTCTGATGMTGATGNTSTTGVSK
jgi:hypothetical protein